MMKFSRSLRNAAVSLSLLAALNSCRSTYMNDGTQHQVGINHQGVRTAKSVKPNPKFPATIVRSSFHSRNLAGTEPEVAAQFAKLETLQGIKKVVPLNPLLLRGHQSTIEDLRIAAAKTQGDMLFAYQLSTSVDDKDHILPLRILSLGILKASSLTSRTEASGLLVDVNSGFVYGSLQNESVSKSFEDPIFNRDGDNSVRKSSERKALLKLTEDFFTLWPQVYQRYR